MDIDYDFFQKMVNHALANLVNVKSDDRAQVVGALHLIASGFPDAATRAAARARVIAVDHLCLFLWAEEVGS